MLGVQRNGINLICTEQSIPEFPNLLFGTTAEGNKSYFDATLYLGKENPQANIQNFFAQYRAAIESLCESHDIPFKDFYQVNQDGHYLIDANFTYLFIAFADKHFLAYMCDRIHELFSKGFVVSDTYLIQTANERIPQQILKNDRQQ